MDKNSLTFKAFKNISYNVAGYFWPLFFTLFITPIIIFGLGPKNYGIYLFINSATSLLGLIDLGIGAGITKNLSFYLGRNDSNSMKRLAYSANSLFLIIGIIGVIITY
jgi:O-antigen/teichoic acid export membrane protein